MKQILTVLLIIICLFGYSQSFPKFDYDCDSVIVTNEDFHRPSKNEWFMAAANLKFPADWKNQDTIILTAFDRQNMVKNMTIIDLVPHLPNDDGDKIKKGSLFFSSLLILDHGEYGAESDSSYYSDFKISGNKLTLQEKFWWSDGKGKKFRYKIEWIGRNCAQLIRLNPSNEVQYPIKMTDEQKKDIITIKSY